MLVDQRCKRNKIQLTIGRDDELPAIAQQWPQRLKYFFVEATRQLLHVAALRIGQCPAKRANRVVYLLRRTEISPLDLAAIPNDVRDVPRFSGRVMFNRQFRIRGMINCILDKRRVIRQDFPDSVNRDRTRWLVQSGTAATQFLFELVTAGFEFCDCFLMFADRSAWSLQHSPRQLRPDLVQARHECLILRARTLSKRRCPVG